MYTECSKPFGEKLSKTTTILSLIHYTCKIMITNLNYILSQELMINVTKKSTSSNRDKMAILDEVMKNEKII